MANPGVFGLDMLTLFDSEQGATKLADAMRQLLGDFENKAYRTLIARSFSLEETASAHTFLQSRQAVG
jgi:NADPH:quinone reductase-like Zn-dependent oxidoreductase